MTKVAPYGSWTSPISLDHLVEDVVNPAFPLSAGEDVYWVEQRPADSGRCVIVRAGANGTGEPVDVFGPDFHARTLVHEYGGLQYAVHGDTVYFSNYSDQRLYRTVAGSAPEPITPPPPVPRSFRFAAPVVSADGRFLYCVRERHPDPDLPAEVVNDIVMVPTDGSSLPLTIAEGHDFFSHPTLSPDGRRLAFIAWDHPNMPWDETVLWEVELDADGRGEVRHRVVGDGGVSVSQPKYSPAGQLAFIADWTGWWNLYLREDGHPRPLAPMEAELGGPDWTFGMSSYDFLSDGSVVATWSERGVSHLGLLRQRESRFDDLASAYTTISHLRAASDGGSVLALAGAASEPLSVVRITPGSETQPVTEVLKRARTVSVDAAYISTPQAIEFPTDDGLSAFALYYPPHNPDFSPPDGELPPLIVASHGGPTGAFSSVLDYGVQFFTSRGIAVVAVNYGGSTGYGRAYRERLKGRWGIVDLNDCVHAAKHLADTGRADRKLFLIRGGSAGGYTTLCAATFTDVFAAGTSYFGVADAGALAAKTHKFESRYLDGLIGPWPQARETYEERSPLFHTESLETPLILFQGLEDKVVPPSQAEEMAAALHEKGIPHAYIAYEGEQHGFRRAENVKRTAEAELYFYGRVLGFSPADELEPVEIDNAERLGA